MHIKSTGKIDENNRLDKLTNLPFPPPLEAGMTLDGRQSQTIPHPSAHPYPANHYRHAQLPPQEIIHQDIKPENIVIDKDGTVKIIDFGSARVASLAKVPNNAGTPNLAGTKNYTAPEYQLGYKSSRRSDIYSIGVIVYEMLTGKLPYGKPFDSKKSLTRLSYISARDYNDTLPFWINRAHKKLSKSAPLIATKPCLNSSATLPGPTPISPPKKSAPS